MNAIRKKTFSFFRIIFLFLLIFAWIFSGWPQIGNFPPKVQKANAAACSIITMATGTDPVAATIAPGSGIADRGLFTLTGNGNSCAVISAMTVTLAAAGTPYVGLAEVRITDTGGTTTYFSAVTSFSSNAVSFSGGTGITATTSATTYKIRVTPKTHALMDSVPGASYAITPNISAWTTVETKAGSDTNPNTTTIDNLSPASATVPLASTAGIASNTLKWTASAATDFQTTSGSIILRWAASTPGADVPAEGSTYTAGNTIGGATVACVISSATSAALSKIDGSGGDTGCTTTALTGGQAYSYKVFSLDLRGNYDAGTTLNGSPLTPLIVVDTPAFTDATGTYNNDLSETITVASPASSVICYTTDGTTPAATTPGTCSTGTTYSGAVSITATATTLKAIGTKVGYVNSAVQSATYTLAVGAITSSPGPGTYPSTQSVTLNIATTTGAVAHYTTNGTAVSCSSTTYSVPFDVSTTTTVKAIGCKTNYNSDTAISDLYTITVPAAPTDVAASDGTYMDKVTVTWTKSTGATGYRVYRDAVDVSGLLGDMSTYDDTGASVPTITAGSAVATDGTYATRVALSLSGISANNGTTHTYKVVASNATGNSADSSTDNGYRGVGSLTYQWQRSAADSDAGYSDIIGANTASYDDTGAPSDGSARYYKCILNATGATQQTSAADRGYKGVISITLEGGSGTVTYGIVATSQATTASGVNQTQTVRNNGNVPEDFDIKGQNSAHWTLGTTAGNATYKHEWCMQTCDSTPVWNAFTASYAGSYLVSNIAANGTQDFDLQVTVPTSNQGTSSENVSVFIQATQH